MEKGMVKDQRFRIKFNGQPIAVIWADKCVLQGNAFILFYRDGEYVASFTGFSHIEKDTMAGDTIVHIVTV